MTKTTISYAPEPPASTDTCNSERYRALALWGGTLFLSAFLLFQVQPVLAKLILPWFGGAAAVWTTSVMFFQMAYLLGNLYAWWLVQRSPRVQSRVHIALLAASFLALPILPSASWKPAADASPTLYILGVLATTVGLPFVLLSATSPLLQAWYVRGRAGSQPYRFYALSNAGSLLALLSYPFLVEPLSTTRHQAAGWSLAYAVFGVACAAIAFRERNVHAVGSSRAHYPTGAREKIESSPRPDWKLQLLWVALAADAAALFLGITNHLSQNVAAVPMLWIVPLSLYLLSLILCFAGHGWYDRSFFLRLLAVALGGMTYALSPQFVNAGPVLLVPLFCAGLFLCCMVCHGELEKLKPPPEHLTLFYLLVSAGGALGGIFVGVIAPWQFQGFYELPLAIAGCAVFTLIALYLDPSTFLHRQKWYPATLVAACVLVGFGMSVFWGSIRQSDRAVVVGRNFYGLLRVTDLPATDRLPLRRQLVNGAIVHGVELLDPARITQPTTYFGPQSGAGIALLAARARGNIQVGIIGLGAGTLASYGQAGDRYVFYDINPLVIRVAQAQFAFLRESKADTQVVPGDARLSLEREPAREFDVFVVDAFSGDAIPIHLLTREAFEIYLRLLRPHGVLAIHISNKYLDLEPVVRAAARTLGLSTATVVNAVDEPNEIYTATWVLLAREPGDLPVQTPAITWEKNPPKELRPWTDDYSNLLEILK